jgi:regulator of sigma E protease
MCLSIITDKNIWSILLKKDWTNNFVKHKYLHQTNAYSIIQPRTLSLEPLKEALMGTVLLGVCGLMIILAIMASMHELAHYYVSSLFKAKIVRIQVGIPAVIKFKFRDTEFAFGPLPIIAFVKPEDPLIEIEWWKNLLIAIAGPLSNLLLGGLIILLIIIFPGLEEKVFLFLDLYLTTPISEIGISETAPWTNSEILLSAHMVGWVLLNGLGGGILFLLSLISLSMGALNLIPFPGLDGARVLGSIFQGVLKKRGANFIAIAHAVGVALLVVFNLVWMANDLLKPWLATNPAKFFTTIILLKG